VENKEDKMKRFLVILTVVLGLAVIGVAAYAFMVMGERNDLQEELASTQQELETTETTLASTEAELTTTKNNLSITQTDLSSTQDTLRATQDTLTTTQSELAATEDELSATEDELSATEDELGDTRLQLHNAEDELDRIEQELDDMTALYQVAYETLQGLDITLSSSPECTDAVLIDNPEATNPSWAELKAFLAQDMTENHQYILNEYDCSQFSRDLHNRAEAAGIRAAVVHINLVGESVGHALNAFLTTDYGLVYVDCTEAPDKIARVKAGLTYRAVTVVAVSITNVRNDYWWNSLLTYYYIRTSTGGQARIESITIFW
jgi:flagellar basal body-associated protein FliL